MNIVQLKYFCAVCEHKTVVKAAEKLCISQPSLSDAIKKLEKEFGIALFKRSSRGMIATYEGEVLYKMSRELISKEEELKTVMEDLGEKRKRLRLGIPPMIGSIIMPEIYKGFIKENPEIAVETEESGGGELIEKLLSGDCDMIIVPHSASFDERLSFMHIARLEIVCYTSKENGISKRKYVTPELLSGEPLVLFENSFFQTEEIKKWFDNGKAKLNVLLQTGQFSTMQSIILNNTASGFMFRQFSEKNKELVMLSAKPSLYLDISLVWKKGSYTFTGMRKFKEYVKENNPFEQRR